MEDTVGGICNEGQLTISQNSKIYGNYAGTGGDGHHSGEGGYGGGITTERNR